MNGLVVFSTFFHLSLTFAIRSSWSEPSGFFCCPYRTSRILTAKNIICLISFCIDHLVMAMYRVISCVVERGYLLWPVHSFWQNSDSLCPASFCTPRPNLPVTPGISLLPTFAFQSLEGLVGHHRNVQLQLFWH